MVESLLIRNFQAKDLGNTSYLFGIEVTRAKMWVSLSSGKYLVDLLVEIGVWLLVPMVPNVKLTTDGRQLFDHSSRYSQSCCDVEPSGHQSLDLTSLMHDLCGSAYGGSQTASLGVRSYFRYLKLFSGCGLLFIFHILSIQHCKSNFYKEP